jgi:hypothetical protein
MSDLPVRGLLSAAIEQENWELAALCLLAGMAEAARLLPPDAVEELLEVLAGEAESPKPRHRHGGRRRGRHS